MRCWSEMPPRRARKLSRRSPATSAAAPAMRRSSKPLRLPPSACAASTSRRARRERKILSFHLHRPARARGSPLCRGQRPVRRRYRASRHAARRADHVAISRRAHSRHPQGGCTRGNGRALRAGWARAGRCDATAVGRSRYPQGPAPAAPRRRGAGGYEPLAFVLDGEEAFAPASPPVHAEHGSNVLLDRTFTWGEVERDFSESSHWLSLRLKWGRSSTVPVETFAVLASWDPWREILDVFASVQMPRFPDQIALALKLPGSGVRVHNDVDVGGSYGVKRGIKHAVLAGYLSRRLGFPVRLIEDRLENMRG